MSVNVLSEPVVRDAADLEAPVGAGPPASGSGVERAVTLFFVVAPLAALCYAIVRWWGHGIGLRDVVMVVVLYGIVGHGVTVGFHRLFTHRSFSVGRPLKI